MLRDYLLGVLSVPLSDRALTTLLAERDVRYWVDALDAWMTNVAVLDQGMVLARNTTNCALAQLVYDCTSPYSGRIGFYFITSPNLQRPQLAEAAGEMRAAGITQLIFVCCVDVSDELNEAQLKSSISTVEDASECIIMEPQWVTALLVERAPSLVAGGSSQLATPSLPPGVSLRRTRVPLQALFGAVIDEPGTFAQKFRELQREDRYDGTVLLATTFLPPVTHSVRAVQRFYSSYGVTDATLTQIAEKAAWEHSQWVQHIERGRRVDILDKAQLEEYFDAPEYYQMPLTVEELQEQLRNVSALLDFSNYSICLASEAVDISYEIRSPEVRIRTDRRNKGQPRSGRIGGIVFTDSGMAEVFEREFWNTYRHTSQEFKNKQYVLDWLRERVGRYKGPHESMKTDEQFDVFLCHSSRDRAVVKELGKALRARGIRPWLDEWNLIPGRPWQHALEAQIGQIKSAAAFVGADGFGPWQQMELDAFLREFVRRGCPVIPVFLANATEAPELPLFLKGMHWVDFRSSDPDPMEQLIWGIRGKR